MGYDQEARDEVSRDELEEEYSDFLKGKNLSTKERLLSNMVRFSSRHPRTKRIITRNLHRRKEVYESILGLLEQGPQRFTALYDSIGGSRFTISRCLQGLCEQNAIRRNNITRNYELADPGLSIEPSKINTPSNAYGARSFKHGRVEVNESYAAKFFPRKGLVRIDESKPRVKSAVAALLDPIYRSYARPFQKPRKIDFEIEINITVKGTLVVGMTKSQQKAAEWNKKEETWKSEETYVDHESG